MATSNLLQRFDGILLVPGSPMRISQSKPQTKMMGKLHNGRRQHGSGARCIRHPESVVEKKLRSCVDDFRIFRPVLLPAHNRFFRKRYAKTERQKESEVASDIQTARTVEQHRFNLA